MKKVLLILLMVFPFILMAAPIKIKTIQSYFESPTLGKTYDDKTVVFEVDTLEKKLVVKSTVSTDEFKITKFQPTINRENVTIIKFEVQVSNTITKKYVISIPNPITGKKISVEETMITANHKFPTMVYLTDTFVADDDEPHYNTKYLSKYFHHINESTSTFDHKCTISYSDKIVMIGDLDGTEEMHILYVSSIDQTNSTSGGKKTYRCYTKDEEYIFEVLLPHNDDSTPIFKLTRLVDNSPVYTTTYSGDIIE